MRVVFDDGSEKIWIRKGLADELRLDGTNETERDGNKLRTDLWESLLQATRLNIL